MGRNRGECDLIEWLGMWDELEGDKTQVAAISMTIEAQRMRTIFVISFLIWYQFQ